MKAHPCLFLPILTAGLLCTSSHAELTREPGAIYLEDVLPPRQSLMLRVIHPAPIYYQSDGKRRLGTLKIGYDAEIIAVTEKAYMVRAKALHAKVSGWITPKALQAHNGTDFRKSLDELYQRQMLVRKVIDEHKVALGMTQNEVELSLGRPDRVNSAVDDAGNHVSMEYVSYKRVPQPVTLFDDFGVPFTDFIYVRVEVGKVTVNLTGGIVQGIKHEGGARNCGTTVVLDPPPAILF